MCIHSLNGDLPLGGWSTVGELNGTPEPMEFRTLINTHYSIYRDWALPHLGREREGGKRGKGIRGREGKEGVLYTSCAQKVHSVVLPKLATCS